MKIHFKKTLLNGVRFSYNARIDENISAPNLF